MKDSWHTKRLADFAIAVSTGPFGSLLHKSDYVDKGVPLVNPINMVDENIVPDETKLISDITRRRLSNYVLKEGDVVVARRGEIGRCAVVGPNEDGWVCGTGSFFIRPLTTVEPQFLAYLIRSDGYRERLERLSTGTTMRNLSNTALGDLKVSMPPLREQQRILGIIGEAFHRIAVAKAHTEKNLQNARALFESRLQSVFTERGEGWVERRLGDLATFRNGINFTKSGRGDAIKIVGVKNFQNDYWAPLDHLDTVITDGVLPDSDMLMENDLLFVRSNGNMELIGRCLLVGAVADKITHSGFTIRARLNDDGVVPKYLCHFLKSNKARQEMIEGGTGTNIKSLNQSTLSTLVIPFPPGPEQSRIVDQIEALRAETQRLESIYRRKLIALEALKKSLLHQAFNGQL
jgi:type I restriction enzyme S subunit